MNGKTLRFALAASLSIIPVSLGAAQERAAVSSATQVVRTVTLDDAVELALRANPAIISAQGTLWGSRANRRQQAIGQWLPTVSASSGASKASSTRFNQATGQNVTVASAWSYNGSLSANLLLFDQGFQRVFQGRQANAFVDRDEAALIDQKFQVTLQTKQAFYDAVAAGELERVRETQVQQYAGQLRISKEKLAAGSAIRSDTLRATVLLGNQRVALIQARATRSAAEAALARVIGMDGSVKPVVDSAVMQITTLDTAALRAEAVSGAPSITRAEAGRRAAEAAVTIQRQNYLPRVTASYSQQRSGTDLGNLTPGWNFGLNLSWQIFNGFGRETGLSNALASRETAIAQEADARRLVEVQVTQQVANLAAAEAQLEIAQASRGAAEEDLRISRERYRLGAATLVDVLQAQAGFDNTQVDAVNARKAYQVAKANLSALVGREL